MGDAPPTTRTCTRGTSTASSTAAPTRTIRPSSPKRPTASASS
jgi:hypothetical protein